MIDDNGYTINAQTVSILSEENSAYLGEESVVNADALTVLGDKTAKIGQNSNETVTGELSVVST